MAVHSVQWNLEQWAEGYEWLEEGDEWSRWWGDTDAMWLAVLRPRIAPFVPTGTVLEIAPGFGRWTHYLKDLADRLIVVDLAPRCIEHCRKRFAGSAHLEYHVNDGTSLAMVADDSVDLAFSMDSLVHADATVLERYLEQLATKLRPDGVGFFHHSNLGAYARDLARARRRSGRARTRLVARGRLPHPQAFRDPGMSAERFADLCDRFGLACIGQETISWSSGAMMTDALSLFTRKGSRWDRPNRRLANPGFVDEAEPMRSLWSASSFDHDGDATDPTR
ncbi:MAG: class I SAM-dependent methyltransferase [Actinobacteria bacterium]|nr:class I SAM-dependent methyltransferase [Actinomycetota bacterium]